MRLEQLENVNKEAVELKRLQDLLKDITTKDVHIVCERRDGSYGWSHRHAHEVLHPDDKQILADIVMRRVVSLTESLRLRGVAI